MAGLTAASTLLSGCGVSGTSDANSGNSGSSDGGELYVYNWGEYIDEDVISQFEEETGITVVYDLFETNEEMYPVIEAGGVNYDVVCPSDYMIQKMRENDLLAELKDGGKTLAASGRKAVALPAQLSDLLGMTIKGQTKVNLELTGSDEPLAQVDRMVNKLVLALLSAALLVGSSLICTTDMKPKLLGIPCWALSDFSSPSS